MARYEWDEAKRRANLDNHGFDFADVRFVAWKEAARTRDLRRVYGEDRWQVALPLRARIVVLILVYRPHATRIISMRAANDREIRLYVERRKQLGAGDPG